MTTYSTRLWRGELLTTSGNTLLFTVPIGKRIVIRDLGGSFLAGTNPSLSIFLVSASVVCIRVSTSTAPADIHWDGRQVAHEGEAVYGACFGTGGQARVTLSGYLLDGAGGPVSRGNMELPLPEPKLLLDTPG